MIELKFPAKAHWPEMGDERHTICTPTIGVAVDTPVLGKSIDCYWATAL